MRTLRRLAAPTVVAVLLFGPATGCSDDPGEDEIGDGEINDPGD